MSRIIGLTYTDDEPEKGEPAAVDPEKGEPEKDPVGKEKKGKVGA